MKIINFNCSNNEAKFYSENIGKNSVVSLNGIDCTVVIKYVNGNIVTAEIDEKFLNVLSQIGKN